MVSGVTGGASFLGVGFKPLPALETGLALGEKRGEAFACVLCAPAPFLSLDLTLQRLVESIAERPAHRALDFGDGDGGSVREAVGERQGLLEESVGGEHARNDPEPERLG